MTQHPPGFLLGRALAQWPGAAPGMDADRLAQWSRHQAFRLPARWEGLMGQCSGLSHGTWASHWHRPLPAGKWAPNALVLLEKQASPTPGQLVVDTDPDENGLWCAWWHDAHCLRRLASSWEDLAAVLQGGPQGLEAFLARPVLPAQPLSPDTLPFSSTLAHWLQSLAPGQPLMGLTEDQQALAHTHRWTRYPLQPWFGVPLETH